MRQFCILQVPRGDFQRYPILDRLATSLQASMSDIGIDSPIVQRLIDVSGRTPIVLGSHRALEHALYPLPEESICFNFEHLTDKRRYIEFLKMFTVWDFSPLNLKILKDAGHNDAHFCGVGFHPTMCRSFTSGHEETDVLFFGRKTERRMEILRALEASGIRLQVLNSAWGEELDSAIARAKIVLNIHRHPKHGLEMVRVGELLANERFVVSESGGDPDLDAAFDGGLVFAPYDDLIETCLFYLEKADDRRAIAARGARQFRSVLQSTMLRDALDRSSLIRP